MSDEVKTTEKVKSFFDNALISSLLGFLSDIIKLVVNGVVKPEELVANPEMFAMVYSGLQVLDKFFGEDELAAKEIAVDEIKEAMEALAKQHNIPQIRMYWD